MNGSKGPLLPHFPITTNHKPFYTLFSFLSRIIIMIKAAVSASIVKAQFQVHYKDYV